jgi:hypothetical protein
MKAISRFLFVGTMILGVRLFASDAEQWKIQITGLRIVAPPVEKKEGAQGAFFQPPGVTVVAALTPAQGKIVSIDQFKSKVDAFTDDKGTDLLAAKSDSPFNKPGFGMMDTKESCATVEIQAAGLPAKGASALNISGTITAKIAAGTKEFTVESADITNGTHFTCGELPIEITKAGLSKAMFSNEQEFSVTFSSAKDLESISTLDFFDAQGTKLEARKSEWGGGMGSYMVVYVFKKSVDHAKIVATCWTDLKTVEVPLSVKTGVGL